MDSTKQWRVKASDPVIQMILSRKLGISPLMAQLLINRGVYTVAEARDFLDVSLSGLHSPYLMRDMQKGVELLVRVLEQGQNILVYGDYDVDGVTGTALLVEVLRLLGGRVDYHIPQRLEEGYGLHTAFLHQAAAKGVDLVVTVDCGISNVAEVAEARERGGPEIIITDHHEPPAEIPPAAAVINPKRRDCHYPFRELAGVGVAYKLARALLERCAVTVPPDAYLDLVCLGTVADIVPLHGENRILVKHGLEKLSRLERQGIRALCKVAGIKTETFSTREVGYMLAPRINAAGRLGDAETAVKLMLSEDPDTALQLAAELGASNKARQELETVALGEALGMLDGDPSLAAGRVLVLASAHWHPGVIGIVASRLVEQYRKPVLLIACEGDRGKGSARSVRGFDLVPALEYCSPCLIEYGGHAMAAGFSIHTAQVDRFRDMLNRYADEVAGGTEQAATLEIDALVSLDEITYQLVEEIEQLKPFGQGNPSPLLGTPRARVLQCRGVGKNEAHLKLVLGANRASVDGIGFNLGRYAAELAAGREVSVAFTPTINHWQGRDYLQIQVDDLQGGRTGLTTQPAPADELTARAGDLILVPETLAAGLRDFLVRHNKPVPPQMNMLQVRGTNPTGNGMAAGCPPAPVRGACENRLIRLEPAAKCILLLANSARHTMQLARFVERHNPRFAGGVSLINGFWPRDRIAAVMHDVARGGVKLLVATYSSLPEDLAWPDFFGRICLARPPATARDWAAVAPLQENSHLLPLEAFYSPRDWQPGCFGLDELAPEWEQLACCYTALRTLAPGGTGACTAEEALQLLNRSGCPVSSSLFLVVAAAVFSDLDLLQYGWEEGMLKYKLLTAPAQKRELNASGTYIWTRRIKAQCLDWIKSGSQSNGV